MVAFLKKFQWKPGEIDSVMLATTTARSRPLLPMRGSSAHGDRVDSWSANDFLALSCNERRRFF